MIKSLIVKVSSACNLNCDYCYFFESNGLKTDQVILSQSLLRNIIVRTSEYCERKGLKEFLFCWHGGEPLLAGYDFFENIIKIQRELMPHNVEVENSIQTNGILLDEHWIKLFKEHNFYVGVSMDGPATIHDRRRKTRDGRGTHVHIVERLALFRQNSFPIRILAVITPEALLYGKQIYEYFRKLGCYWMDFLYPMCNLIHNTFDERIAPNDLGRFYCDVFDAWFDEGNPEVYIRSLHDWCMLLMGGRTVMCHSKTDCSYVLTINTDGTIHCCDDLTPFTDSLLGHVISDSFSSIEENERLTRLGKMDVLFGKECLECEYFPVCKGGCTLFRAKAKGDFTARNYYCESQKIIVKHIRETFDIMAARYQAAYVHKLTK